MNLTQQVDKLSAKAKTNLAAAGLRLRAKMEREGKAMVKTVTIAGVGFGGTAAYGLLLGATEWGRAGGYIPGTYDADAPAGSDEAKGIRLDLVLGALGAGAAVAFPMETWSDAALGLGMGMGIPAVRDLTIEAGRKIAEKNT